ncbi:copper resistance protein CopD [Rothia nasimurium]|uniref:Copper resistance protein CopD n=1 Tax=Rothia nasimurium TaxID=85336 RepID=A0A4Y9F6F6_9MICC|nr:cytochrome c oxidase assembly protein [Rothia nasimurium]MBF0807292.1 bifunctional copper resistance protein CopD/cytochrome c oxidase assembly protein [Rothia nasimurium]TFU24035.1 copper resistance protein CopD [Rothia nasimurium]
MAAHEMECGLKPSWIWAFPAASLVALVLSLLVTGSNAGTDLADAGALVRWGLPVAESLQNFSMAATMGSLVFALGIVPRFLDSARGRAKVNMAHATDAAQRQKNLHRTEHPAFTRTLTLASAAAITWTIAAIAVLIFSYADISGRSPSGGADYTSELISYITTIDSGKQEATSIIVAATVATLVFAVRSLTGLLLTLGLSLVGIVAMALGGHSSGGDDHMGAVNSLGLHLLGVVLWCGGLMVLAFISGDITGEDAGTGTLAEGQRGAASASARKAPLAVAVLRRYSVLALFGFVLVVLSGVVNALVRMNSLGDLFTTTYGALVLAKLMLTLVLGAFGVVHRLRLIPMMQSGLTSAAHGLWYAIACELVLMGATSGLAVSLSRTPPPAPETLDAGAEPVRIITLYDMPPEPHLAEWSTQWRFDWFWVAFISFAAFAYLWALIKVRRAGGHWPLARALSWFLGLFVLLYITCGALAVYSMVLFSVHMVEHMLLTMVCPIFLVLGAPVTLLLRALEPRQDGTRGPREWILRLVHSGWSKMITHPIFAAVNFAGSIVIVYFTPLFGVMLRYHVGHEFMLIHFLITGYIFSLVLIGIDPIPNRPTYPMRLIMIIATLGYHAFVGISIMQMDTLLQASWFGNLGRPWGLPAIDDQKLGGSLMWAIGEIPTMIIAVAVAVQWSMDDKKVQKRIDRQADRDGDAELNAYNDMFAQLAEKDTRR